MKNFYTPKSDYADHATYGGQIYLSDFETDHRGQENPNGSAIAKRIASAWRFDEQCKKNTEIRKEKNNNA